MPALQPQQRALRAAELSQHLQRRERIRGLQQQRRRRGPAADMSLQGDFVRVAEEIQKIKATPTDDELKELYGLYKQVTVGDINIDPPGMLDLKGKAKWEAWNQKKGTSNEDAMKAYITKAHAVIEKYKT